VAYVERGSYREGARISLTRRAPRPTCQEAARSLEAARRLPFVRLSRQLASFVSAASSSSSCPLLPTTAGLHYRPAAGGDLAAALSPNNRPSPSTPPFLTSPCLPLPPTHPFRRRCWPEAQKQRVIFLSFVFLDGSRLFFLPCHLPRAPSSPPPPASTAAPRLAASSPPRFRPPTAPPPQPRPS
jgi:hypothetical protein